MHRPSASSALSRPRMEVVDQFLDAVLSAATTRSASLPTDRGPFAAR